MGGSWDDFSGEIGISFSTSSLLVLTAGSCLAGEHEEFGRNIVDAPNPFTFLLLTSVGNEHPSRGQGFVIVPRKKGSGIVKAQWEPFGTRSLQGEMQIYIEF